MIEKKPQRHYAKRNVIIRPLRHNPQEHKYTFEEIYKEYQLSVTANIGKMVDDDQYPEDLYQEIMIKLWKAWDRIEWDKFEGFLGTIATRVCITYTNKVKRSGSFEVYASEEGEGFEAEFGNKACEVQDPEKILARERFMEDVHTVLKSFKERNRNIFMDNYFDDIETDEIAEKYNISKGNLHVTLHRIRQKMADGLGEEYEGGL